MLSNNAAPSRLLFFGRLPFFVLWLLPAMATLAFCLVSCLQVRYMDVNDFDFGIYLNLLWNVAHGFGWDTTLYRDLFGFSFLGDHLVLGVAALAPVILLWESPYALSVVHGVAMGSSFFLLPRVVREVWRHEHPHDPHAEQQFVMPALLLSLLLLASRPYLAAWAYQTHFGSLAAPLVLAALLALYRGRLFWLCVAAAFMLAAQERASLFVGCVGIYAALVLGRPYLGLALFALSSAWFLAAVTLVIPSFQGEAARYMYMSMLDPLAGIAKKTAYLFGLPVYCALLPLCGRRAALAALSVSPLLGLALVSARRGMYSFSFHYNDAIIVLLLVASAHGLAWLGRREWPRAIPVRVRVGLCVIILALLAIDARKMTPPYVAWSILRQDNLPVLAALHEDLAAFSDAPDSVAVFTHQALGPRFALRSQRRLITAERAAQPMAGSLVIISPVVNQWETDYAGILRNLRNNGTLLKIAETPRMSAWASGDVAPLFAETPSQTDDAGRAFRPGAPGRSVRPTGF